jgi:pyridoxal phosphate enzyme (YggS family)
MISNAGFLLMFYKNTTMTINKRIQTLHHVIEENLQRCQRPPNSVTLVAVSKGHNVAAIEQAFSAGITDVGENYWQEAQNKILLLQHLPIVWHFLGPIQSNKASAIAEHFSWVHSIERTKIATLLSQHRPQHLPPLNVCIQINLDAEVSKSGVNFDEAIELVKIVHVLPNLTLRGLMTISRPQTDEKEQYKSLLRLTHLLQEINQQLQYNLDTLSMGMSDDLIPAIQAGSTLVRVGQAIFGSRPAKELL